MVKSMAAKPSSRHGNPDPNHGEEVAEVRSDAIMATGRSATNQINNVLGTTFSRCPRRARDHNMEMKIAAAKALAALARRTFPMRSRRLARPKSIPIHHPVPFDPQLISFIPPPSPAPPKPASRRPSSYGRLPRAAALAPDQWPASGASTSGCAGISAWSSPRARKSRSRRRGLR